MKMTLKITDVVNTWSQSFNSFGTTGPFELTMK